MNSNAYLGLIVKNKKGKKHYMQKNKINKYLMVLFGFFIPISTAVTNILLGLILLFWILDNIKDRFKNIILVLRSNPVALMGGVLFLIYLAGSLYSNAETEGIVESLRDGVKFAFIPMMMIYFKDEKIRPSFMAGFICAMVVVLFLSYLLWLEMLPGLFPVKGDLKNPTIFFLHITQNIFMAYMVFVFAVWARFSSKLNERLIFFGVSLIALFNVLFLVQGRTGHLIMIVLLVYFFFAWRSVKSIAIALSLIVLMVTGIWMYPSNPLVVRATKVVNEVKAWDYEKPTQDTSSSGLRMEFYLNSLKLIKESPVFGTGTGSFAKTYHEAYKDTKMIQGVVHPHNDYLMFAVQFGVVGLLVLLGFFMAQWKYAGRLTERKETILSRGFILTMLCACMVSSPLIDHAEGWFFAFMSAFFFANIPVLSRDSSRDD